MHLSGHLTTPLRSPATAPLLGSCSPRCHGFVFPQCVRLPRHARFYLAVFLSSPADAGFPSSPDSLCFQLQCTDLETPFSNSDSTAPDVLTGHPSIFPVRSTGMPRLAPLEVVLRVATPVLSWNIDARLSWFLCSEHSLVSRIDCRQAVRKIISWHRVPASFPIQILN